jgi:uncharacterized repeat protein (TIGR03943 family)
MTSIFHRLISAGVLIAWSAVLCGLYFSGRIASYLVPTFQPLTIACGAALALLALLVLIAPAEQDAEAGCATGRSLLKSLLGATVLLVPLIFALTMSKDEFGATTVMNRNYVSDVAQLPAAQASVSNDALPGEGNAPASPDDPSATEPPVDEKGRVKAEIIDLLYAAQLPEMRPSFENKQVVIIGQLMPAKENNPKGDRYDAVRMFMTCCAADAQPVALPVQPATKPGLPEMTWVKVTGKAAFPVVGGQRRPLIEGATIEKTQPPEDTFLY